MAAVRTVLLTNKGRENKQQHTAMLITNSKASADLSLRSKIRQSSLLYLFTTVSGIAYVQEICHSSNTKRKTKTYYIRI